MDKLEGEERAKTRRSLGFCYVNGDVTRVENGEEYVSRHPALWRKGNEGRGGKRSTGFARCYNGGGSQHDIPFAERKGGGRALSAGRKKRNRAIGTVVVMIRSIAGRE